MALQLKTQEGHKIALRHLTHKMDTESGQLQHLLDPLVNHQLAYVRGNRKGKYGGVYLRDEIEAMREKILSENKNIDDMRESLIKTIIIQYEEEYRSLVKRHLTFYSEKQATMTQERYRLVLDPVVTTLQGIYHYKIAEGIEDSLARKHNKVAELAEGVPSFAQISSVMRIEDLQNNILVSEWAKTVSTKAHALFEEYDNGNEDEVSKDKMVDLAMQQTEEMVWDSTYAKAYNLIKNVIELNEDGHFFLNETLKQTTTRFMVFARNRNAVKRQALEYLEELGNKRNDKVADVLQEQLRLSNKFNGLLKGIDQSELTQFLFELSGEDVTTFALSMFGKFKGYTNEEELTYSELIAFGNLQHIDNLIDQLTDLYMEINAKVPLDQVDTQLELISTLDQTVRATILKLTANEESGE